MRKTVPLVCSLALALAQGGCAPKSRDSKLLSRDQRTYPDPTLGTNNPESQWYRTQTIAPPSAAPVGGTDLTSGTTAAAKPARAPRTPAPTHAPSAGASTKSTTSTPMSNPGR